MPEPRVVAESPGAWAARFVVEEFHRLTTTVANHQRDEVWQWDEMTSDEREVAALTMEHLLQALHNHGHSCGCVPPENVPVGPQCPRGGRP